MALGCEDLPERRLVCRRQTLQWLPECTAFERWKISVVRSRETVALVSECAIFSLSPKYKRINCSLWYHDFSRVIASSSFSSKHLFMFRCVFNPMTKALKPFRFDSFIKTVFEFSYLLNKFSPSNDSHPHNIEKCASQRHKKRLNFFGNVTAE